MSIYASDLTIEKRTEDNERIKEAGEDTDLLNVIKIERFKERYNELLDQFKNVEIFSPTHSFDLQKGVCLTIGENAVNIIYPGPGHSDDNVVVHVPHLNFLFGGCFIVAMDKIYLGEKDKPNEVNLEGWLESISNLRKKLEGQPIDWVIPGHPQEGRGKGCEFSPSLIEYTENLTKKTIKRKAEGDGSFGDCCTQEGK